MNNYVNDKRIVAHVDDEERVLIPTNLLLKKRGIKTIMCKGAIGLRGIKDSLDLIVSDGEGIIEDTIKERDLLFPDVPILIYSGNESLISNYRECNGIKGVLKPANIDYLAERIYQFDKIRK